MKNLFYTFSTIDDGNIAYHVNDNPKNVQTNRKNLCNKHSVDFKTLKSMDQVHSNTVRVVDKNNTYEKCDALITNKINTPLMVMIADCIPLLFYESTKNVIGVAHAGRDGTYQNIAGATIQKMKDTYNIDVKNLHVILGPSIQKCCYEVSEELAITAKNNFGKDVVKGRNVDLQLINKKQLMHYGVLENNIEILPICTKCSQEKYYSYRLNKECGRFCGLISIKQKKKN
jgi:YfiH family protein